MTREPRLPGGAPYPLLRTERYRMGRSLRTAPLARSRASDSASAGRTVPAASTATSRTGGKISTPSKLPPLPLADAKLPVPLLRL